MHGLRWPACQSKQFGENLEGYLCAAGTHTGYRPDFSLQYPTLPNLYVEGNLLKQLRSSLRWMQQIRQRIATAGLSRHVMRQIVKDVSSLHPPQSFRHFSSHGRVGWPVWIRVWRRCRLRFIFSLPPSRRALTPQTAELRTEGCNRRLELDQVDIKESDLHLNFTGPTLHIQGKQSQP